MRSLKLHETRLAADLCEARHSGARSPDAILEGCPTCRADIVRLIGAPAPSLPVAGGETYYCAGCHAPITDATSWTIPSSGDDNETRVDAVCADCAEGVVGAEPPSALPVAGEPERRDAGTDAVTCKQPKWEDAVQRLRAEQADELAKLNEDAIHALIGERDSIQEAFDKAYIIVVGEAPEWSSAFGMTEALDRMEDALDSRDAGEAVASEEGDALVRFRKYIAANYGAGCVLSDPQWHAPRLYRAAIEAYHYCGDEPLYTHPAPSVSAEDIAAMRNSVAHLCHVEDERANEFRADGLPLDKARRILAALEGK